MGRLFWKFFFVLWLTLMTTVIFVTTFVEFAPVTLLSTLLPPPDFKPPQHRPSPTLPIVMGTLSSLLFSFLLARYFANPIRTLQKAFSDLAGGKLETRVATAMGGRYDELANLGRDFDQMATQIGNLMSAQQRLLHDVSHELRSPLARMQVAIGLAQQQPEKIPATLIRIERESQRISDLVGELLVLSRLEVGAAEGGVGDIDLAGFLGDIVEDARFEAESNHIRIAYSGIDDIIVQGHGELLHRAVENVLRNAIQHCKPNGQITVDAAFDVTGNCFRISIEDEGPGVEEQYLTAIFQPFFRSAQQSKTDSVGLGLAIAHRAVTAHGGQIYANNRPQGGLHVDIEVPLGIG
ncbi:MAG: ATP-binding protein [Methylovulum sp.]|nr:ATP-binding protein [Methylovulum sp.]